MKKKLKSTEEAIESLEASKEEEAVILLPSGCDLFNLACSGNVRGWVIPGLCVNIIGDSNSGKTISALDIQASINKMHKDAYEYDMYDYESSLKTMNIGNMFGRSFASVLNVITTEPGPEATIEKFYSKAKKSLITTQKPRIIVCDSWDSLSCKAELQTLDKLEKKKDDEKGTGGFGMERAKATSRFLGKLMQYISSTGSVLIILSQTRDKAATGFTMAFADNRSRSGGRALKFYSAIEIWYSCAETLGKDRKRPIGMVTKAVVKRSKLTGKYRTVRFPILNAYGVDNTRASIMFLAEEGVFKSEGKTNPIYSLNDLTEDKKPFKGTMIECVEHVEGDIGLTKTLRKLIVKRWRILEKRAEKEACGNRRRKFED